MAYLKRLPSFDYFAPKSIQEACSLLTKFGSKAKVIAGGTDLLVKMKYGEERPRYLIGLRDIPYLNTITWSQDEGLQIGALATHQSIADNDIIWEKFQAIAIACSKIGTPQIRSMGTIGGNLCNAAPSADSAPPLIAFSALVKLVSAEGERTIPVEEFFVGPGETALSAGEILSEIQIPSLPPHAAAVYLKLPARSAIDIAAIGVAVLVILDSKNQTCTDARIVLGAVAPTPMRAKKAEEVIRGRKVEHELICKVSEVASQESRPLSDVRSSANYRKHMVNVLTKQAISQALLKPKSA